MLRFHILRKNQIQNNGDDKDNRNTVLCKDGLNHLRENCKQICALGKAEADAERERRNHSVASNAPNIGNAPARIIITAPVAMVKRLTTLVIATRPTFWLNDVIGRQPKTEDSELIKPSRLQIPRR